MGSTISQQWVEGFAAASGAPLERGLPKGMQQPDRRQGSVPVAAVVQAYISDRILAQHRCVSRACVRSVTCALLSCSRASSRNQIA